MNDPPPKSSAHQSDIQRIEQAKDSSLIQAEMMKKLQSNDKVSDDILESLTEIVIAVDAQQHIIFINAAAEKLFNWDSKNVLGLNIDGLLDIVHSSDNTPVDNPVSKCLRTQKTVEVHGISLIDPEGKAIPVNIMATLMVSNTLKETGVVLLIRNITGARQLQDKLEHQATHDTLTNLWNRRAFEQRLAELQEDAKLNNSNHALLYIDLDQFKIVNDTAGHLAGDELLKQICLQTKSCLRTSDMLARLGGDEFGVLLSNCGLNDAFGVGEKIRAILDDYQFVWEGNMYKVGSSIGIAILDNCTADMNVLGLADIACYSAKKAGRNRVHLYTPDDAEQANHQSEMNMITNVRSAIDNKRLVLYSQAIVPLQADKSSYRFREILLRMLDENGKIILPEAFVPAAERYGLMQEIDLFVLEAAIEWLESQDDEEINISISLSSATLSDLETTEYIEGRFHTYRTMAKRICFEITETAAIANLHDSIKFFERLKKMGFTIALNDFGSGLSSFGYLKHLPIDIIKIDGSFVSNMLSDSFDAAMIEAIVHLARKMSILTVAQRVEDAATQDMLKTCGVDLGQGLWLEEPTQLKTPTES